MAEEGNLSNSFIDLKIKKLSEAWERIEVEHEALTVNALEAPIYADRYLRMESKVEDAIIELQDKKKMPSQENKHEGLIMNRVTIPKFQGDYFKWVTFRDLFVSMVVDNKGLSKSQKMQLLKTNLVGEADTLIGDLTISEVNFDSAWNRLMNRYDNNRVVIYKLINKMIGQQMCKGDAHSIKKLLDTTDQIILALANMGRPTNAWDDWVVVIVTQKLGESSQKDWEQKISGTTEPLTWEQLKSFMEEHFRMLERVEGSSKRVEAKKQIKSYQGSIDTRTCIVCNEDHGLFQCHRWKKMAARERWEVVKSNKLCFLCLKVHKDQLRCEREKPCKRCDKKHNTWLHEDRGEKGKEISNAHCTIAAVIDVKQILLATAVIHITDDHGKKVQVRVLIDSGSERINANRTCCESTTGQSESNLQQYCGTR